MAGSIPMFFTHSGPADANTKAPRNWCPRCCTDRLWKYDYARGVKICQTCGQQVEIQQPGKANQK